MELRAYVDPRGIEELNKLLDAFPQQAIPAGRRAVRRTLSWVRTHGGRALAGANSIPLKALRLRRRLAVKTSIGGDPLAGVAWFGTVPIKAAALGTPRQTKTGAKVRGHVFAGAFVATMPTGYLGVFTRKGDARLPIKEQTVPLQAGIDAVQGIFNQAPEQLRKNFLHEFSWLVRGGRRA